MRALSNFDWNHALAFLATAEEGSLSAAARALGLTQPTLGRQVTALEEELGFVLFERVGRGLELTPSGRELLGHVREMRDAAERVSLAATGQNQAIEGRVVITASDVFSVFILPTALKHLRDIAPKLDIEVVAENDIKDLQRREADIAVRHLRPEQPELIARLLLEAKACFYASSAYLDRVGRPETIEDMLKLEFISFGEKERVIGYLTEFGVPVTASNFRIGSENGLVAWELARRGFGVLAMSDLVGDRTPGVERVLPDLEPITFPVWLTTHRELHSSKRIRLVFDTLAEFLTRELSGKM